ncbi:SDR family oxidoreductase [Corynebacterium kroppenstedtii]|uniref:SDR family oxidoreductase n=1 Tax=Corynebacterium sp. PCR 32 TaxID=3351342 RepID=UPI0030A55302
MTRTVFISGAAQGIGRATAQLLANHGWIVGAYDISNDFDWATHHNIHTGHLDVTHPDSWHHALNEFSHTTGGRLDVLINNAGILYGGPFVTAGSFDKDASLVDVNVKGVLFGARASYPWLCAQPGARLINVASAAAIYGTPDMAVYSATKFAVRGITEALDLEWDQDDITVSSVCPLYAKTGMLTGVETGGTKRMGVKLSANDIAAAITAVAESSRRTPAEPHHPVGMQAKMLYLGSHFAPHWLIRFVNAKLTTHRKVRL